MKKSYIGLVILCVSMLIPFGIANAGTATDWTTYVYTPAGFEISPTVGSGTVDLASSVTISSNIGGSSGASTTSYSTSLGSISNGAVQVYLEEFELQKQHCTGYLCFLNPYPKNGQWLQVTDLGHAVVALQGSGSSEFSIPTSITHNNIPSTTWTDLSYTGQSCFSSDPGNCYWDMTSAISGATFKATTSNSFTLGVSYSYEGFDFSFGITFTSSTSNTYNLNAGYYYYATQITQTIFSWDAVSGGGGGGGCSPSTLPGLAPSPC